MKLSELKPELIQVESEPEHHFKLSELKPEHIEVESVPHEKGILESILSALPAVQSGLVKGATFGAVDPGSFGQAGALYKQGEDEHPFLHGGATAAGVVGALAAPLSRVLGGGEAASVLSKTAGGIKNLPKPGSPIFNETAKATSQALESEGLKAAVEGIKQMPKSEVMKYVVDMIKQPGNLGVLGFGGYSIPGAKEAYLPAAAAGAAMHPAVVDSVINSIIAEKLADYIHQNHGKK